MIPECTIIGEIESIDTSNRAIFVRSDGKLLKIAKLTNLPDPTFVGRSIEVWATWVRNELHEGSMIPVYEDASWRLG